MSLTCLCMVRHEPEDIKFLQEYPACLEMFQREGCYTFCKKLQGYHNEVARAFAEAMDRGIEEAQ
jgi:hypothetical protein